MFLVHLSKTVPSFPHSGPSGRLFPPIIGMQYLKKRCLSVSHFFHLGLLHHSHRTPQISVYRAVAIERQRPPCLKGAGCPQGRLGDILPHLRQKCPSGIESLHRLRGPPPSRRGRLWPIELLYKLQFATQKCPPSGEGGHYAF